MLALSWAQQPIFAAPSDVVKKHQPKTLAVSKVELVDFQPHPKHGITRDGVQALIQSWLDKLGPELTLKQLHGISDEVTIYYREHGLMMARASIQAQEITDETVKMTIVPGHLGEVVVTGKHFMKPKTIARPFLPLINDIVIEADMKAALKQVDNLPGLDVFSYFSIGRNPGETRVNLKVLREEPFPWEASVRTDNYGNKNTGEQRFIGSFSVDNLSGHAERYQFGLLQTLAEENVTVGYINLGFPFFHPKLDFSWYLSNSQFNLGENFEILEIQGSGHESQLQFQYRDRLTATSSRHYSLHLGLYDNEVTSDVIGDSVNTTLQTHTIGFSGQQAWRLERARHQLGAQLTFGQNDTDVLPTSGSSQDDNFTKISLQFQTQWQLDTMGNWYASLYQNLFWSNERLPGTHQTNLSGATINRGFEPGEASVDTGMTLHAKLLIPRAKSYFNWLNKIRPLIFLDYTQGTENAFTSSNATFGSTDYSLASTGLGFLYQQNALSAELYLGYGFKHTQQAEGEDVTDILPNNPKQAYFTVNYVWE